LLNHDYFEARAYKQTPVFAAALEFTRAEGILPAPESAHAIRAAIDEALEAKAEGRSRVIVFCLTGHGHFDLAAYDNYLSGKLQDFEYSSEDVAKSLAKLPRVG
jgi:predicted alternative tryptophan synthase beta-subunit